jgi:hypothetical protein
MLNCWGGGGIKCCKEKHRHSIKFWKEDFPGGRRDENKVDVGHLVDRLQGRIIILL